LTIINPAITVFLYSADLARIQENWGGFQAIPTFHLVVDVAGLGLTALAVYAGIALWTLKPKAVRTAKTFLIAAFAYNAVRDLACLSLGTGYLIWVPTPTLARISHRTRWFLSGGGRAGLMVFQEIACSRSRDEEFDPCRVRRLPRGGR
jgi:hypothetical protein